MKIRLLCCLMAAMMLLGCVSCAEGTQGDYTYEEQDIKEGGSCYIRSRFAFYYLQQMYQAAGQGADALAAYVQEVNTYSDRIYLSGGYRDKDTSAYRRNLFLSRYSYSMKDVILVPDQKNIILKEIKFVERTDSNIWITYADAVQEYGGKTLIQYVSKSPEDPLAQVLENPAVQAYGEPYAGDGFEAQAYYDRESEWYSIWITDAQGNALGYIDRITAAEWVEERMSCLSYLKTQSLEKAVKKAKAPGRYDYDRIYKDSDPGDRWLIANSDKVIRELYVASGKGEEAYQACAAQNKAGNYLPRERDMFLSAYYDLADRTVLVPTGEAAWLTKAVIYDGDRRDRQWQGVWQTCDLKLIYRMANGESFCLVVEPTDERTQRYAEGYYEPLGEAYRGKGFTAQLMSYGSKDDPASIILWWNSEGELMGFIQHSLDRLERVMAQMDDFKAVTFHEAVQQAK